MVTRGVAERQDLLAARLTDEAAIVFLKTLLFHSASLPDAKMAEYLGDDFLGDLSAVKLTDGADGKRKIARNGILGEAGFQRIDGIMQEFFCADERRVLTCRGENGILADRKLPVGEKPVKKHGERGYVAVSCRERNALGKDTFDCAFGVGILLFVGFVQNGNLHSRAFLKKCKKLQLIPSMTVNQVHFMKNKGFLKDLVEQGLIYGLGVSLVRVTNDFIDALKEFPNAVLHVINGMVNPLELEALSGEGLKILILGYKQFRRGEKLYQEQGEQIEETKSWLYEKLPQIINEGWFEVVSFDNLAIKQLDAQRLMSNEDWEQFYMGDDGSATLFVDMVNREFAKSSTSTERYPLEDDIVTMFEKVRTKENNND